jgi:hypothetical protein
MEGGNNVNDLLKGVDTAQLSNDINVITAEINTYQRLAGEAIFEIGRRLKRVKYNPKLYGLPEGIDKEGNAIVSRGAWGEFLLNVSIDINVAGRFIKIVNELEDNSWPATINLGLDALYLIATMPEEQREQTHTVPSTGETKAVTEMTRRELREVKKALKESEKHRELAERDAQILRDTLESIEYKAPEIEIRTEYVEVTDESSEEKLRKYEEMFGDISIYEQGPRRVSNRTEVMSSIQMFSHDTRNLLKKYAYFEQYSREIREMPDGVRQELKSTLGAINNFVVDMAEAIGINNGNIIDAEIIEN